MSADKPTTWPEWAANSSACYDLAIACKRAEMEAGRKLSAEEMLAAVDRAEGGC